MATTIGQAIPVSTGKSLLRVVSSQELKARDDAVEAEMEAEYDQQDEVTDALAAHIRARMTDMRNFRNAEGISERLLHALRT
jgi:hypothetical protein